MSVCILLPPDDKMVPVASEQFYADYWIRGAEALGLVWIPLFQTGVRFEIEDLEDVINEFCVLKEWAPINLPADCAEHMVERIELSLKALWDCEWPEGGLVFIG